MNDIELKLNEQGRGAFVIEDAGQRLAEMEISVAGDNLTVYHTEVSDKLKGQGIGSKLLDRMVGYARDNKLKVIPLCPFVHAQFKRHPDKYGDIWNKTWHAQS
jgi:predicted GNAT family acetyltransferase